MASFLIERIISDMAQRWASQTSIGNIQANEEVRWIFEASGIDGIVSELQQALHEERDRVKSLERDLSLLEDAVDTALLQRGMTVANLRRILRIAAHNVRYPHIQRMPMAKVK